MLNIGERFDFALKELKITNKEIAESFNISSQNVSNLKKNDRLNDLISQIATKYNINLNWLVTGKGNYIINNNHNDFINNDTNNSIIINKVLLEKAEIEASKFGLNINSYLEHLIIQDLKK